MLCSIVKFDRFNLFGLKMSNVSVIEMRVVLNFGLVTFMHDVWMCVWMRPLVATFSDFKVGFVLILGFSTMKKKYSKAFLALLHGKALNYRVYVFIMAYYEFINFLFSARLFK